MTEDLDEQVDRLWHMTTPELRQRYAELFGEITRIGNKDWLRRRLAWRLQALAEGGLSDRAQQRAEALACDADLRLTPPRSRKPKPAKVPEPPTAPARSDPRLPLPGTVLVRSYKGKSIRVQILKNGFEYQGKHFDSLSAVAKAITGSHCNGFHFFRLARKKVAP